jgi:hypothetical protein
MKTVYFLTITQDKGKTLEQYLKLSEINLLTKILRENKMVNIQRVQITEQQYKLKFNV